MKSLPAVYLKYCISSLAIALLTPLLSFAQQKKQSQETSYWNSVEKSFLTPPDSIKPWIYWYWISDNISQKGITRDLETMKELGIGEAFIGNIGLSEVPYGKVPVLSREWWKLTTHAVHEGARLGVNIGIFNSPGWSQSGGPWVKPEESMRYLVTSQLKVKGPLKYNHQLSLPGKDFQEVALLAFPAPAEEDNTIISCTPAIDCLPGMKNARTMIDGDTATACLFEHNQKACTDITITINLKKPLTARSLELYPAKLPFIAHCELQVKEKDQFKTVSSFVLDRSNPNLNVGPMPYAPEAVAFSPVTAATFRLILTDIRNKAGLAEIRLSASPVLDHYIEKQLGKMHQTPHPMWDAYEWPEQPALKQAGLAVDPSKILNITQYLSGKGILNWNVPEGNWVILRVGMVPTGVKNSPAPPEATGLEVDKMNKKALKTHFNAFIGKILEHIPPQDRKALKHVVADSYEVGSENWTDGFDADFRKKYGYDPIPWLPVLTGRIVGSPDQSDRFLWDMRRLIADRIAYEYVGGLRELSEQKGLRNWLENYGHWGFPAEFLQYGGQSDDVSGEFWAEGDLGSIELKDASSAAHIYGKNQVWAESFTA
ncbi:MAG TPA: glycosyl hydrolase, partial [Chitinophagaceae bacterium]